MAQEMTRTGGREASRALDGGAPAGTRPLFQPRTDIYETDDSVVVLAEMPGIGPDGVDITLERRVLTIRGRAPAFEHERYRQVYAEYREVDYERLFTLSEDIDRERIKATQKDGVLTLVLPKAEQIKSRKIAVQSS
jgi:HSP20 family molecular chaperone IbpA